MTSNKLIQLDNPDASEEVNVGSENTLDRDFLINNDQRFFGNTVYLVEDGNTHRPSFILKSLGKNMDHNKVLVLGDQVIFRIR